MHFRKVLIHGGGRGLLSAPIWSLRVSREHFPGRRLSPSLDNLSRARQRTPILPRLNKKSVVQLHPTATCAVCRKTSAEKSLHSIF